MASTGIHRRCPAGGLLSLIVVLSWSACSSIRFTRTGGRFNLSKKEPEFQAYIAGRQDVNEAMLEDNEILAPGSILVDEADYDDIEWNERPDINGVILPVADVDYTDLPSSVTVDHITKGEDLIARDAYDVEVVSNDRQTAAQKWEHAHSLVARQQRLEVWGLEKSGFNGIYSYAVPKRSEDKKNPPVFRRLYPQSGTAISLFVTMSGFWCFGRAEHEKTRASTCFLYSSAVPAGTLPEKAGGWQWYGGDVEDSVPVRLPEAVAAKWARTREALEESPILEIRNVEDSHINGRYEFMQDEEGENGAPIFRHESNPDVWLYVAYDGKWWVGSAECKDNKWSKGWIHSFAIEPGEQPPEASGWMVSKRNKWEQQPVSVTISTGSETAVSLWEMSHRIALPFLEIWGVEEHDVNGVYALQVASDTSEPPMYKHNSYLDYWIFFAKTGRWMVGSKEDAMARKDSGFLHSASADAGTLPDAVGGWKVWQPDESKFELVATKPVWMAAEIGAAWRASNDLAQEHAKVLELSGVGNALDGMWDLVAPEDETDAPAYRQQRNQGLSLYVGMDNKWWVGRAEDKAKREPQGWLRSTTLVPGTLPAEVIGWEAAPDFDGIKEGVSFA